ncbi:translation initiation factor IF-2-like [Hemicordylus capensis]|uniref:translation initiation factor IF-2-like n=1 Tax=Hemicordylus capensis TaxID=884348 RepID=UPI0023025500|nr:translation initiation factor IF-2-like [Hemicordylus capensis]
MGASSQPDPCQEVGAVATRVLGSLVLLCMASNAILLLCPPPRRRDAPHHEHRGGSQAPQRRHAKQACSTCHCCSGPGGLPGARAAAEKGTQTGPSSLWGSQRASRQPQAPAGSAKGSEHSSSWLGTATALAQKTATTTRTRRKPPPPPPPPSLSASSPKGSWQGLAPARPARIVLCSLHSAPKSGPCPPAQESSSPSPVGQVVYDARWLRCVMGKAGGPPPSSSSRGKPRPPGRREPTGKPP